MCLDLCKFCCGNSSLVKSWREDLQKNGQITCYKVMAIREKKGEVVFETPFRNSRFIGWGKNKWLVSNRLFKSLSSFERFSDYVDKGIHVFLEASSADKIATTFCENRHTPHVVLPVICRLRDLVAVGTWDADRTRPLSAVFKKISIDRQKYDEILTTCRKW